MCTFVKLLYERMISVQTEIPAIEGWTNRMLERILTLLLSYNWVSDSGTWRKIQLSCLKECSNANVPKTFGFIDKNTYMNSFWRKIKLEGKHFDGIIQKWITIKSSFDTLKPLNAKDIQNSVWTNYIFPLNSLLALSP